MSESDTIIFFLGCASGSSAPGRTVPCRSFPRHSDPPFGAGHYRYTDGNKCVKHRLTLFNKKFIKIYVANRLPVAYSIDEKEKSFSVCRHCNLAFIPDVRAGPLERNRKIGIKCEERRLSYGDKEHFENR